MDGDYYIILNIRFTIHITNQWHYMVTFPENAQAPIVHREIPNPIIPWTSRRRHRFSRHISHRRGSCLWNLSPNWGLPFLEQTKRGDHRRQRRCRRYGPRGLKTSHISTNIVLTCTNQSPFMEGMTGLGFYVLVLHIIQLGISSNLISNRYIQVMWFTNLQAMEAMGHLPTKPCIFIP